MKPVKPILQFKDQGNMHIINPYKSSGYNPNAFVMEINTQSTSQFILPLRVGFTYNCTVDWGDGQTSTITAYNDPDITHNYASDGVYIIQISGVCQTIYFNNGTQKLKLTKILQWGNVGFTGLFTAFYGCTNLTTIPNSPITGGSTIGTFFAAFQSCTGLSGTIPVDLFRNCTNASTFQQCFYGCTSLSGSIPTDLFRYNTLVTTFQQTFNSCTGLTGSIPVDLFRYNTLVTNFQQTFYFCTGLTGSIPVDLFRYCPNVTTFLQTFYVCGGLTGSIPVDLFRYNTLVTTFQQTFNSCTGLTGSIPVDLFRYNTLVTNFQQTFNSCFGLTNVSENIFYYNGLVTNYFGTFYLCRNLVLPSIMFDLTKLNIATSFLNFLNVGVTFSPTGTVQDIWNYATHPSLVKTDCFNNCTALTNYAAIPADWK